MVRRAARARSANSGTLSAAQHANLLRIAEPGINAAVESEPLAMRSRILAYCAQDAEIAEDKFAPVFRTLILVSSTAALWAVIAAVVRL